MNIPAVKVIYKFEMLRAWETLLQSFASPVLSTSLYFVVFGSAIGSRIEHIEGVGFQHEQMMLRAQRRSRRGGRP